LLVAASHWPVSPLADRPGWRAAVASLSSRVGSDSFVVVWPPEQAAALAELPPSLRAADAVPVESPQRRRYLSIFVIGPVGFDSPPELAGARPSRERFDEVEVGTFVFATGDRVVFDLRSELEQAAVQFRSQSEALRCDRRRPDGGWSCPGRPDWNHVAPTTITVSGSDWPCVWAHPATGHDLVIDLGPRALADRVELEAAMRDDAVAGPYGASVNIRLEVDGAGSRRLAVPNRRGIVSTTVRTKPGRVAGVRAIITTPNDGRRHLGINLRLVETR
jgi:hypothetical protein